MPLEPGATLGSYLVKDRIGTGGMGEVYRARDTKLSRDVALKVLPDAVAEDAERLARFRREARLLASLNHPNIAQIYGLEDGGRTPALVLELVEGPTLAERIAGGAIPLDEALPIARQIVEALETAHALGIVHRDLKPANIKVTAVGVVKVLDFGLARALSGPTPLAGSGGSGGSAGRDLGPATQTTMTGVRSDFGHAGASAAKTRAGLILGTAAYMSPEQARGLPADRRADVWAFGVVLFEMLTGRQAFGGGDVTETLAAVLREDVDWTQLPAGTPPSIRRLLRRCVERDKTRRLPDIGSARLEIDDVNAMSEPVNGESGAADPRPAPGTAWRRAAAIGGLVLAAAITTGFAVRLLTSAAPLPVLRMPISLDREGTTFRLAQGLLAISPDGLQVVWVSDRGLALRQVSQLHATVLPGTGIDGGQLGRSPVFSPDGRWIAYEQMGRLHKIAVSGGAPLTLGPVVATHGISWGADDTILYGEGSDGIWRVPGEGGTPEQVITVQAGEMAHGPQMLPGAQWVLFTLRPAGVGWEQARIVAQSLATGERTVVVEEGRDARYLPSGHLVYARDGTIVAAPFDAAARTVTGGPVPMVEGVRESLGAGGTGTVHFDVSASGSLVYLPGDVGGSQVELVWVDRAGRAVPVGAGPGTYRWARVSPDGTRLAVQSSDGNNADVWIYDLRRATMTRLTFDEAFDGFPLWSPDGMRVVFQSSRLGGGLFWKPADGTGETERLLEDPLTPRPYGWSTDGRLVFDRSPSGIAVVPTGGDGMAEVIIEQGRNPALSPDGRWLAYDSGESGMPHVYVRPFPGVDAGRWQVSADPSFDPLWSPGGRELFFNSRTGMMMAAIETEPSFTAEAPEPVPYGPGTLVNGTEFDIARDGDRFLFLRPLDEAEGLVYVQNWQQELKDRVPTP